MPMALDVPIGTNVAGYRVERLLGSGAAGVVYLARDEHLNRLVALKLLPPGLAQDLRFRARFVRESQLAAGLEHPAIVPIYGAGEADGLLYLAMRYVPGGDLRELIERVGRLEPEKNPLLVVEALAQLDARSGGRYHLTWVGRGGLESAVRRRAEELGIGRD